jgi:hypothetical protein
MRQYNMDSLEDILESDLSKFDLITAFMTVVRDLIELKKYKKFAHELIPKQYKKFAPKEGENPFFSSSDIKIPLEIGTSNFSNFNKIDLSKIPKDEVDKAKQRMLFGYTDKSGIQWRKFSESLPLIGKKILFANTRGVISGVFRSNDHHLRKMIHYKPVTHWAYVDPKEFDN